MYVCLEQNNQIRTGQSFWDEPDSGNCKMLCYAWTLKTKYNSKLKMSGDIGMDLTSHLRTPIALGTWLQGPPPTPSPN
jgi:hypothetical protein